MHNQVVRPSFNELTSRSQIRHRADQPHLVHQSDKESLRVPDIVATAAGLLLVYQNVLLASINLVMHREDG